MTDYCSGREHGVHREIRSEIILFTFPFLLVIGYYNKEQSVSRQSLCTMLYALCFLAVAIQFLAWEPGFTLIHFQTANC